MTAVYWSIVLTGLFAMVACGNQPAPRPSAQTKQATMPANHSGLTRNLALQGVLIMDDKIHMPREFGQQVHTLFSSYLRLEEALAKCDTTLTNKATAEMIYLLDLIPDPVSDSIAMKVWANHKTAYTNNLKGLLHAQDMEERRSYFALVSGIFYATFKSFEMETDDIHVFYCPMAFDNKGGYWLRNDHKIRNPYFCDQMRKCGEITEIIL